MPRVDAFLKLGRDQGCSDIHLSINSPPLIRRNGELQLVKYRELNKDEMENLVYEILSDTQIKEFQAGHELDFSYTSKEAGRFRVSLFKKVGGLGAAFRVIPHHTPVLSQLGLPPVVKSFLTERQGLVLVTGSTGTGKSTTLAAMINEINQTRRLNIITLEDPIEHVHISQKSLVVQREIGKHVQSYTEGLRAALREDPDVILIGELREPETILMAMSAAETGHLVLGTLHTTSATKTIDRIIDAMPTEHKQQAANFLAQHLKAVVSQKLIRSADGNSRRAIAEIFVSTPAISNMIASGKVYQLPAVLQTGRDKGMQLMDQALLDALNKKLIDPDDAYIHAIEKQQFQRFVTNAELLPHMNLAIN